MDKSFLDRAETYTVFNIISDDITSIKFKKEIRSLINKHWFPNIDESSIYLKKITKGNINKSINKLKKINQENFDKLYSYNMKGLGPGELLLFYLVDEVVLGGSFQPFPDVILKDKRYEVKATKEFNHKVLDGRFLNDFKLGGTLNLSHIMVDLKKLAKSDNSEIPTSKINDLRRYKRYQKIEKRFREEVSNYFNRNIIFLNNNKKDSKGEIISIKKILPQDIFIDRMTSGTIKPLIRIGK